MHRRDGEPRRNRLRVLPADRRPRLKRAFADHSRCADDIRDACATPLAAVSVHTVRTNSGRSGRPEFWTKWVSLSLTSNPLSCQDGASTGHLATRQRPNQPSFPCNSGAAGHRSVKGIPILSKYGPLRRTASPCGAGGQEKAWHRRNVRTLCTPVPGQTETSRTGETVGALDRCWTRQVRSPDQRSCCGRACPTVMSGPAAGFFLAVNSRPLAQDVFDGLGFKGKKWLDGAVETQDAATPRRPPVHGASKLVAWSRGKRPASLPVCPICLRRQALTKGDLHGLQLSENPRT